MGAQASRLENALRNGDNQTCISIYTNSTFSKQYNPQRILQTGETPLHLASRSAIIQMVELFMSQSYYNIDLNTVNHKRQTCLHAVCDGSDHPNERFIILKALLDWRPQNSKSISSSTTTTTDNNQIQKTESTKILGSSQNGNKNFLASILNTITGPAPVPLPEGWEALKHRDGRIYYINHSTRSTTWTDPRPLPEGWEELIEEKKQRYYYVHHQTKKSTWDDPRGLAPLNTGIFS